MIPFLFWTAAAVEPLEPGWPLPVKDGHPRGMLVIDQLEYRVPTVPGSLGTDLEGWFGGDRDRLRYRAEGALDLGKLEGEGEIAAAYSRLVSPWLEVQFGLGLEAQNETGQGFEARVEAGIEYVVPYDLDLEALLRVSQRGRVTARVSLVKELMLTQRLIVQLRAEATGAAQSSVQLDRAQGLEDISGGIRLRYELKREFAPYLGGTWSGGFEGPSGTSKFAHSASAVGGVRLWY